MIDKLEMRTNEFVNCSVLSTLFPNDQICKVPDSLYRICCIVKIDNKELLTIKVNPRWGGYESKIIANPSKWESYNHFFRLLSKLCNTNHLEIIRIDHAVDVLIPIDQIYSGIRIKYKKGQTTFKENCSHVGKFLTGFIFGQKPELYCIYDKGYQLNVKKLKRDKANERGKISRIELRQFGIKIKYKHLSELLNYVDNPPFIGIEFYQISDGTNNSLKAQALAILMNHDGLSRARVRLNEQNNFDRNCKKYLKSTDLQKKLNQQYQAELRQFFEFIN